MNVSDRPLESTPRSDRPSGLRPQHLLIRTSRAVEASALGLAMGASAGFAFIEAPAASKAIADLDVFADLIEVTIVRLTRVTFVAGTIGAVAACVRARAAGDDAMPHLIRFGAIEAALALLFYHARVTIPKMNEAKRAMGGGFRGVAEDDLARVLYRKRHRESTRIFGSALALIAGSLVAGTSRDD